MRVRRRWGCSWAAALAVSVVLGVPSVPVNFIFPKQCSSLRGDYGMK